MKKHLLGFALFSLIVGVTVAAAAYYFKMSKPLNEIPAVNLSGEQNYKSNLSGKSAGQSVIVDLKAKKVFTEVNLANYKDRHLIDSLITEIYEAGSNKHIFSTTSENDQNHNSEIYFSARFNPNRGINPQKNYYARILGNDILFSGEHHLIAEDIPVTVFAGKRNY